MPALGDLRAGDAQAEPERPPEMVSIVAAVIAVIAGLRAGICITAAPTSIDRVCPAIQARMLGVSEPYASAAHTTE